MSSRFKAKHGIDANNISITNIGAPVNDTDAASKGFSRNAANIDTGILPVGRLSGSYDISISGNSVTASRWQVGRTLTLTGDLTGFVTFDGSSNITLTAQILDDSHQHDGRYYTETESDARFVNADGDTITGQLVSSGANNTASGGGQIFLNGATGNRIDWNTSGVAAPSFTTRSVGTKIVLYPEISGSTTDYAFGIEGNTLWSSVPSTSSHQFKWYGGTSSIMTLSGSGSLTAGANMRAPIFYDSDNTNFYVDPAATSLINALIVGDINSDTIIANNSRTNSNEGYPIGHHSSGDTVWEFDPTWTDNQLREYFNSNNVSWVSDDTAPGGWAISVSGPINTAAGVYGAGFPYIAVENDDEFYMEVWVKDVSGTNTHYMGSVDFDHNFSNLGGNPGSFGYWVMANNGPGTNWTKYSGYIGGFGTATGQFVPGTKYWTPQALFNYSGGGTSYISGWKVTRTKTRGRRYFTDTIQNPSVWINNGVNNNNYNENIRLFNAPNGVSTIVFGASGTSGAGTHNLVGYSDNLAYARGADFQHRFYDGYAIHTGSYRAPIFYDSNDTGYYVDPNTTSRLNTVATVTGINFTGTFALNGSGAQIGNATGARLIESYGPLWDCGDSATWHHQVINGSSLCGISAGGTNWGSGRFVCNNDMRSPIYYDYDDTGYYMDPNTTGTSGRFRGASVHGPNTSWGKYLVVGGDGRNGYIDNGDYASVATTNGNLHIDAASGFETYINHYDGIRVNFGNGASSITSVIEGSDGSHRAQIFYDYNDTFYQINPNGTSQMNRIQFNNRLVSQNIGIGLYGQYDSTRYQGVFSMGESWTLPSDGTTTGNLYGIAWSHPNAGGAAGNLNDHGALILVNGGFRASLSGSIRCVTDMRAPIFYDYDNTGHYLDPAGVSYLANVQATDWFRNIGSTGLYSQTWGRGIWPAEAGGNSYGNYTTYASGRNGWTGWGIGSRYCFMSDGTDGGGGTIGVHDNSAGWVWRWDGGTFHVDRGNVNSSSDIRIKTNIKQIENAVEKVKQIRGVTFQRTDDEVNKDVVYAGVIAQEVEKVLPEVVAESKEGIKSVAYGNMVSLLIEAIKEQQSQIETLKSRLSVLENK